ncbi:hypothetical protein MNBD_GAMMA06-1935 [hydrothermal vent metagenome]|uniref:Uncharacterized protein n=1 Tax=hydrothermal vent metagenome TaxID=652676 RepID=A0A3B0WV54_9ZZZZ
MAKYNAIYEGRLPHAIYKKTSSKEITRYPGLAIYLLDFIHKICKINLNFFMK